MAAVWLTPSASFAGSYTVSACSPTQSAGPFAPLDTDPEGLVAGNACGGLATGPANSQELTDTGALFAEDSEDTTADIPNGAEAGWQVTASPGLAITGISYYRTLNAHQEPDLVPGLWTGEGAALETCPATFEDHYECGSLDQHVGLQNLNTNSLFFGVKCDLIDGGEYCVAAAPGERHAQADMYSADVTLSETADPTITSVSGAAWGGGVISGQVPLVLSASDYSGIAGVEVRSTLGALLADVSEPCHYYAVVPCPNLTGSTVDLDTTAATDGTQSLVIRARDAAGNVSTQTSPPVTIDNHGPATPAGLTATLDGSEVAVSWQEPTSPPVAISSASVAFCTSSCAAGTAVAASGFAHVPAPTPGSYSVQLTLTDAAGRVSPAASVALTVPEPPSKPPPGSNQGTKKKSKLNAAIRGEHLKVSGPAPRGVTGRVRVCWRSTHGKQTLGHRCAQIHVRKGRIAVTFHISRRAGKARVAVLVYQGRKRLVRSIAKRARST